MRDIGFQLAGSAKLLHIAPIAIRVFDGEGAQAGRRDRQIHHRHGDGLMDDVAVKLVIAGPEIGCLLIIGDALSAELLAEDAGIFQMGIPQIETRLDVSLHVVGIVFFNMMKQDFGRLVDDGQVMRIGNIAVPQGHAELRPRFFIQIGRIGLEDVEHPRDICGCIRGADNPHARSAPASRRPSRAGCAPKHPAAPLR